MIKISRYEYKRILKNRKIQSASNSSVHKDNAFDDVYKQAVETIHHIQGVMYGGLFNGLIGVECVVDGKTKADFDNIQKGVVDALEGLIYKNDRQVKWGHYRCSSL